MSHTPSRNLVFIGEIGTGKTLLLDTLTKYFCYDNFDAITANVAKESFVPSKFFSTFLTHFFLHN